MLTLTLMRHAKSGWDVPGLTDHDRPLTDRGRRSARAMGQWLKSCAFLPDEVVCSSARRTVETLELLQIDAQVTITPALYHAEPEDILRLLRGAAAPSVLMLGHNPGIADFAGHILSRPPDHPRFDDYPTCATLVARFDRLGWRNVGWDSGEAVDFAIPREVMTQDN